MNNEDQIEENIHASFAVEFEGHIYADQINLYPRKALF